MVFLIFIAALAVCVFTKISVLYALFFGFILFSAKAYKMGYNLKEIMAMSWDGAKRAKNMAVMFTLIGMLTGVWRACGTIPWLVYYSSNLISPQYFILCAFVFTAVMSILLGSSVGACSTMGTVIMIMAQVNGASLLITAGAVISGAYVGDRASPMSSCARLVCDITNTDYYENIGGWIKTSLMPFAVTVVAYLMIGGGQTDKTDTTLIASIGETFSLPVILALPAVLILFLSLFKINVRINMLIGVVLGGILCVSVQGLTVSETLSTVLVGLKLPAESQLSTMFNGGGILSMLKATLTVFFSSAYIGIFDKTNMLESIASVFEKIAIKAGTFQSTLLAGILSIAVSCNQTLAIMLTKQLCQKNYNSGKDMALDLSNSVVIVAALVPWSISCSIPLDILGVSAAAVPYIFFAFAVPIFHIIYRLKHKVKVLDNAGKI